MSQLPPMMPPPPAMNYAPPAPRPVNAWAVVSLVCGIVGCLLVTPVVAIVTGIVGLAKSREQGGRGMAVAGLILGLLWALVGVVAIGGGITLFRFGGAIFAQTAKPQTILLINRVAGGDLSKDAATQSLADADLQAVAAVAKPLGHCQDIGINSSSFNAVNNDLRIEFSGTASFDHGTSPVHVRMHRSGGGGSGAPANATVLWVFDLIELK